MALAADHDRLARFQREAEVLASLNHPNIAAIYGLEECAGITALVMELVEGDDLSQRITKGAIPLDDALPIAKQIAEALEAAHEQGIIHSDHERCPESAMKWLVSSPRGRRPPSSVRVTRGLNTASLLRRGGVHTRPCPSY